MRARRPHVGFHPWARRAHFGWLWLLVGFVIADSFLRHRALGVVVTALGIGIVAVVGMFHTRDAGHLSGVRLEDPVLAVTGAWAAGLLTRELHLTPALAIGAVGVVGGILVREVAGAKDYHGAPIYAGAFVGGTSGAVFGGLGWIVAAGLVAGVLWSVSREAWVGIGGKIGSISLCGVLIVAAVAAVTHRLGPGAGLMPTRHAVGGIVAIGIVSAPLTFWLAHRRGWGAILGSAVTTVIVAGALYLFPHAFPDPAIALGAAWMGASFVGMTLPRRLPRPALAVPLAGLIFAGLFVYFGKYLSGFGGTIGANALIAIFVVRGLYWLGTTVARRGTAGAEALDDA